MFAEYTDYTYYVHTVKGYVCSEEEQQRLLSLYREGDMDARDRFICAQLLWVAQSLYRHYRTSGCLMDLIQDANLQLYRLVDTYDPTKSKFRTYAAPIIIKTAETNRALYSHTVTVSANAVKVGKRLRDTRDGYLALGMPIEEANRETARYFVEVERTVSYDLLTPAQQDAALDCAVSLIELSNTELSLDAPLGDDADAGFNLAGQLGDDSLSPENATMQDEEMEALRAAVNSLPPKQRFVLIRTYGLFGYSRMRTVEIADALGISRQRVNVILNNALAKLKEILTSTQA